MNAPILNLDKKMEMLAGIEHCIAFDLRELRSRFVYHAFTFPSNSAWHLRMKAAALFARETSEAMPGVTTSIKIGELVLLMEWRSNCDVLVVAIRSGHKSMKSVGRWIKRHARELCPLPTEAQ